MIDAFRFALIGVAIVVVIGLPAAMLLMLLETTGTMKFGRKARGFEVKLNPGHEPGVNRKEDDHG
jgi:hypothetical protein